jgi:glycosyltransferase involved in cell wall biosynthesis
MQLHVLANPRNPTGLMNRVDPFAVHAYKYIKHLSPHFKTYHYGLEGSQVDCEHVDVPKIQENGDTTDFNHAAGEAISKRSQPGDIIACFFGVENQYACKMNPQCKPVEPSIGYRSNGVFAPYRIFTSYANMHYFYGERGMLMNPSWYDAVIGNPFTLDEFEFDYNKEDYYLYFGRVCEEKGVHLAIQATEKMGKKLIVAGPGNLHGMGYGKIPDHVEYFGVADAEQRKQLMKKAKGLFGMTYYLEPFGNMIIEAGLSGTPVITTDWGAFPEIVKEGETGYRCKNFKEILTAIENIENGKISSVNCRTHGEKFSDEAIHEKHRQYLERLVNGNFYE